MSTHQHGIFPDDPSDRMIVELRPGLFYQYSMALKTWTKLASETFVLPLATVSRAGAMSADDLKKLNRLVIPPPSSTIIGNDCVAPFRHGAIALYGGDDFVNVEGNLLVRNTDSVGDEISQTIPFHIHQHTYGFDFNLDLPALVAELKARNQFRLDRTPGNTGVTGPVGDAGINGILSGPAGDRGPAGNAPPSTISIESDPVQLSKQPGQRKGLVAVRLVTDPVDQTKYSLVFDRQNLGLVDSAAVKVAVKRDNSSWLLAVASVANTAQTLFYLDVDPLLNAIRQQFLNEVTALQTGYQEIVEFWIVTMSDLFDQQKSALCCALEHCMSATKTNAVREHIENVAGAAAGSGRVRINSRHSNEAVSLSSTGLLPRVGQSDICASESQSVDQIAAQTAQTAFSIDPLLNTTPSTAAKVELPAGRYVATVEQLTAQVDGKHRANIKMQVISGEARKIIQFVDKGGFDSLIDGKAAYEGVSVEFDHDGGLVLFWLPSFGPQVVSGIIEMSVKSAVAVIQAEPIDKSLGIPDMLTCSMSAEHLAWYLDGWDKRAGCGLVVELDGQAYAIIYRALSDDKKHLGMESGITSCITAYTQHPTFAWPLLGHNLGPVPSGEVKFQFDKSLNDLAMSNILAGEYVDARGQFVPSLFGNILFPLT